MNPRDANCKLSVLYLASRLDASADSIPLRRLASSLPRDRFAVTIAVLGELDGSIADSLRECELSLHHIPVRHALDVSALRKINQLAATAKPSVIHAWGAKAVHASRSLVHVHPDYGNQPRVAASACDSASGWLSNRALRRADRVIPVTRAEGERYRRLGVAASRLTRILPGTSTSATVFDPIAFRAKLGLPSHARLIMTAGRLEPSTAMKSAIWGFDMLRYEAPEWHLVILGVGPNRAGVKEFGRALAFDDFRIHFAGEHTDMQSVLALADVVWVTEEHGGVNLAIEAMAVGRPIVGWKNADLTEIVEDGVSGYFADPGERAQLSARTYPLIHEAGLARSLGEAGRQRVNERFHSVRLVEQFVQLYGELQQ